ncbi:MAG TPA: LapA family protein [Alphaproteobacteria bacterium]|nr:LapA family protein [Alphaproteobacteria bacterium]
MKRLLFIITGPVTVLMIAFAIANRQIVALSFDPFSQAAPALGFELRLWMVAFIPFLIGLVLGGVATWVATAERKMRRARETRREVKARDVPDPLAGVPAIAQTKAPPVSGWRRLLARFE